MDIEKTVLKTKDEVGFYIIANGKEKRVVSEKFIALLQKMVKQIKEDYGQTVYSIYLNENTINKSYLHSISMGMDKKEMA